MYAYARLMLSSGRTNRREALRECVRVFSLLLPSSIFYVHSLFLNPDDLLAWQISAYTFGILLSLAVFVWSFLSLWSLALRRSRDAGFGTTPPHFFLVMVFLGMALHLLNDLSAHWYLSLLFWDPVRPTTLPLLYFAFLGLSFLWTIMVLLSPSVPSAGSAENRRDKEAEATESVSVSVSEGSKSSF